MKVGDVIVLPVRQGNPPHDGTIFDAGDYAICGGVGYKQDSVAIVHAINTHDAWCPLAAIIAEAKAVE